MSDPLQIPDEFLPPHQVQSRVQPLPQEPQPRLWLLRRIACVILVALAATLLFFADYPDRGFAFREDTSSREAQAHKLVVMSQLVALLQNNYAYPDRLQPKKMLYAALVGVQEEFDTFLVRPALDLQDEAISDADIPLVLTLKFGTTALTFDLSNVRDLFSMTWKMMEILDGFDVSQVIAETMQDAAITGMLSVLDPHTSYMSEAEYNEMRVSTKGSFGGLGIVISVRDGKLTVMSVMPGTPAARHGIKKNDKIVQINEESSINMTVNEAATLMRGEPGTAVELSIMRDGFSKPERFSIVREVIKVQSVATAKLPGNLAYVRVKGFQEDSAQEVANFLNKDFADEPLHGIVLDLRGNSGGVMSSALDMADLFMSGGTILTTVQRGMENPESEQAGKGQPFESTPLVLLVDHGSASASEIVAGALKYTDRALVIGERTFGKGSVQYVEELKKGAVKMTVAQYLGPHLEIIQGMGIEPHVQLRPMTHRRWVSPPSFIDEFQGEGALAYHLDKAGDQIVDQPPLFYLRYVVPLEPDETADNEDTPILDWPVQLAAELLAKAGAPTASDMLDKGEPVLADFEAEQNLAIDELAFTEGKVWQPGPLPKDANFHVEAQFAPFPLTGGIESWLNVVVTNRSAETAHLLYVRTDCDDSRIHGRTCLIGTLEPGETADCSIRFKLAEGGMGRTDRMWVDLLGALDEPLASTEMISQVRDNPAPTFALSWFLNDETGNRNGLPDVGETLQVGLRVTNLGPGPLKGGLAVLKNLSGSALYLTKGRCDLPDLAPGQSAMVFLELTVQKEAPEGVWKFDVGVVDVTGKRHFSATETLAFPAQPERSSLVSGHLAPVGPSLDIRSAPYAQAPVCARIVAKGTLPYDASFRDFYRVTLPDSMIGWVARESAALVPKGVSPPFEPVFIAQEPVFTITHLSASTQIGTDAQLTVTGVVDFGEHAAVKDGGVSIYNDGIKTDMSFFGNLEPDAGPVPFSFEISLHPGSNAIVLVAYQEGRTPGYYSLFYYRLEP